MKSIDVHPEEQPEFVKKLVLAAEDGPEEGRILIRETSNPPEGMNAACINVFIVEPPGEGHGSAVMQRICEVADANDIVLTLHVQPKSKLDETKRVHFFGAFNFEIDEPVNMTRHPQSWRWENDQPDEESEKYLAPDSLFKTDWELFWEKIKNNVMKFFGKE